LLYPPESQAKVLKPSNRSRIAFWILLFTPAFLALLSFAVGQSSRNAGANIGLFGLLVGAVGAIYCGIWMALRFFHEPAARVLAALCLITLIAAVNGFAIVAGCAGNLDFR
jgi:hypothetical protein